jgi:hypothetical protein
MQTSTDNSASSTKRQSESFCKTGCPATRSGRRPSSRRCSRWWRSSCCRRSASGEVRRSRSRPRCTTSHVRRHRNPGGASVFRVEDPEESSTRLLSCAGALVINDNPMSRVSLTHGAAQAVHALRSGRPRAQGGWVKASCLVREGVPTDRNHAALKQRTTYRLRGTEDER